MATLTNYYIAYVKINKIDILGDNISNNLKEALYLKLKYTDINPIQFDITDIVEYNDYFLFQISFQGYGSLNALASSSDNNTLNYGVLAYSTEGGGSSTCPQVIPLGFKFSPSVVYDGISAGNSLGYFFASPGSYLVGNTPNARLGITCSIAVSCPLSSAFSIQIYEGTRTQILVSSSVMAIPAGATSSLTMSGVLSNLFIGDNFYLRVKHEGNFNTQELTIRSAGFNLANFAGSTQFPNAQNGVSGSGDSLLITTLGLAADNPLYGNYDEIIDNPHFTSIPSNEYFISQPEFQNIISGTGTYSNVKEYNYQLRRNYIPRYLGSRITSDNINTDSISQSQNIQSSSNIYLNPTSKGLIPASNYDTTIFEFNQGNPSGPEIPNLGKLNISQILNVSTTSSVNNLYPDDPSFNFIIKNKLIKDLKLNINQYNTNAYIPGDSKIISNDVNPRSVYMITSYPQDWSNPISSSTNYTTNFLETGSFYRIQDYKEGDNFRRISYTLEGDPNTDGYIFQIPEWISGSQSSLSASVSWSNGSNLQKIPRDYYRFYIDNALPQVILLNNANLISLDESGSYISKGTINKFDISKSIAEDRSLGNRWFVTLFDYPFVNPVNNANINRFWAFSTFTSSLDKINYPFESNGAFEISYISSSSPSTMELVLKSPKSIATQYGFNGGIGFHGLLIWKAPISSSAIIATNTDFNGLGPGNIIPSTPSPTIQNDLNYIVKTFGNKS